MDNKNNTNDSVLDDFTSNMTTISEKIIISKYQISYIILSLIPFTIYRICVQIFQKITWGKQIDLQMSLSNFNEFCKVTSNHSYKDLALTIATILVILIISLICGLRILKYKTKKENVKKLKKGIIGLQLIITGVMIFFISNAYNSSKGSITHYGYRFEWMQSQSSYEETDVTYDIIKSENDLKNIYFLNFAIEIAFEMICSIISIKFQNKIISEICI